MPEPPGPGRRLPATAAAGLTFVAAASVLVLEIAAGRLLAPYVGVSLTTYTGIIGVILAGIAVGAFVGGRVADGVGPEIALGPTFLLGGLASIAAVPIVGAVGALELGGEPIAIVLLATVGFVAPAAILSAVAPMIVRASLVDVGSSGTLVGRLSAVGTAGAIAGTFLTGFVLLGAVPTRALIIGTGAMLVLVGLVLAVRTRTIGRTLLVALVAAAAATASAIAAPDPCQRESAYFCIAVVPDPTAPSGRTLVLDRVRHGYVDLSEPTHLEFRYERWFAAATADLVTARPEVSVLHIGGGSFTFPRYVAAVAPSSRHAVLELDHEVLAVAQDELGFASSGSIDVRVGDARLGIRDQPTDAFDLAIGDAFGSLAVPWHLTTREFLLEVDRTLVADGRYVMNLIDGPALRFVRAEAATLRTIWEDVAVIATPSALAGSSGGNVVLVASHAPIDARALTARLEATADARARVVTGPAELDGFTAGASVLTDDFAPVDQLIGR